MGRTFIRQDTQVRPSDLYDDSFAAGPTLESGAANLENDLNSLRSQLKRTIWADAAGNWYDDIQTTNSKKRAITTLNSDLDDIEEKRFLFRQAKVGVDITVPALQNFVVLSFAASETPTQAAAVDAGNAIGALVATLPADVGSFSLNEVPGPDALTPKNLVLIVDASSGDTILSAGREIFGLLQTEAGVVDGDSFNDTNHQAQLSFVRHNATHDALEAVPAGDIAGLLINYSYVRRINLDAIPETAFLTGTFVDVISAGASVTLDNAVDNQVGPVTQVGKNIEWRIDDTFKTAFQDSTGASDIWAIKPAAGGDEVEFNGAIFDINNTSPADFQTGISADTGGTRIDIGVNAGVIETTAANDLRVFGAGELYLDDGNQTGSTWVQTSGIKLSDTTAEWNAVEEAYGGEVSLLRALGVARRRSKVYANVTALTTPDTDVGGVGGGVNLDTQLPDMSVGDFLTDYDVYLNGTLLRPGATAATNNDYYPGTSLLNGQLKFEFLIKNNDVICVMPYTR